MTTEQTILACLTANLNAANTQGMRQFCEKQIADFHASMARWKARERKYENPMSRFVDALENTH